MSHHTMRAASPLLLLALLLTSPATSRQARAQSAPTPAHRPVDIGEIDRYVERVLRADRVPGAAVGIVHGDSIIHVRGFGQDSRGHPVTGKTSFVLGSMSKSITAFAIMQLVERGQVDLDQPVRRYFPSFRLASPDSGSRVTVRQLLLHTSGIPDRAGRGGDAGLTLGDHVAALRNVEPVHGGRSVHAYASANYLVLGAIIEAVTGASYATYVERGVFQPLSMHNSFTDRSRAVEHGFAGGHVHALGFPIASSLPGEPDRLPTAGLMSSAQDLSHFLVMQLQGGRFDGRQQLDEALVAQMQAGGAPSEGFSYAFGWRDGRIAGERAVHHGGIVADFRGKMTMLPDSGWGVVVLTNVSSAIPWPLPATSHRLADDIAARLAGRPFPSPATSHRRFFAGVAAVMLVLLAMQLHGIWRAFEGSTSARRSTVPSRFPWRASAMDLAFIAFVAMLPRLVGLTWWELLRGAPDVGWWLLAMAALGAATIVVRASGPATADRLRGASNDHAASPG